MRDPALVERYAAAAERSGPHQASGIKRMNTPFPPTSTGHLPRRDPSRADDKTASATRGSLDMGKLKALAEGIDWDTQINRFLSCDFSGLLPEEKATLEALVAHESVANVRPNIAFDPRLILLAWLAKRFVTHSRAAERFASKVFAQIEKGDFAVGFETIDMALGLSGE